jgi:hypothetical protein
MTEFTDKTKSSSILGMQTELYRFITITLIVVDVCLVTTLTYTSIHPLITFILYISFPLLAIISMKTMERIKKQYPFIIFCAISPLILTALCYYSGSASPGWLTTFPLITITLLLLDNLILKLVYLFLYIIGLAIASLLIKKQVSDIFFIVLAIGIYSAVLERCLNYFQMQQTRIEAQKRLIEEKNKEVMDSIHYAKRIQTSLLPTEKYIDKTIKRLNLNQDI